MKKTTILSIVIVTIVSSLLNTSCINEREVSSTNENKIETLLLENKNFIEYYRLTLQLTELIYNNRSVSNKFDLSEDEVKQSINSGHSELIFKPIGFNTKEDFESYAIKIQSVLSKILIDLPQIKTLNNQEFRTLFRNSLQKRHERNLTSSRVAGCKERRDSCMWNAALDYGVETALVLMGTASVPVVALIGWGWQSYKLYRAINQCEDGYGDCLGLGVK